MAPDLNDTLNTRAMRISSYSKNIPEGSESEAINTLELGVNDEGTETVYVSSPSAWRTGIDAAASSHNHSASNITSGTLPIGRGGTDATTKTAAFKNLAGWTKIASVSGTESATIKLSGYNEVMVAGWFSSHYLSSVIIPVSLLNSTQKEIYLGGGYDSGGSRRCCCKLSTTKITGVCMTVDTVSKSGNWNLYAR